MIAEQRELAEGLAKFRLNTERRPLRMSVINLESTFEDIDLLVLRFSLRSGCYSIAVVREFLEYRDASQDARSVE